MVDLLDCTVMPYAWGSRTAIAELAGRASPASGPEAELWMGAHASAPSRITREGRVRSLDIFISENPAHEIGEEANAVFGARLPFLLKLLAAAEPLSIQAHPNAAQARAGFDDEERRGIPRDAPNRNYRDRSHKPELLAALAPTDALCGFRRKADTIRLFDALGVAALDGALAPLRTRGDLGATFRAIMELDANAVTETAAACASRVGEFANECAWAVRLAKLYPGDVGVVSSLLLNLVTLAPGEAIYLGAGNLHAYLDGFGVEIMASSDNVLRGGLTKKHVDIHELERVLDFSDGPVAPRRAVPIAANEAAYETPVREFRLSTITLKNRPIMRDVRGPEILLTTHGEVVVKAGESLALRAGCAAFVPASARRYSLEGAGTVYRATVNL